MMVLTEKWALIIELCTASSPIYLCMCGARMNERKLGIRAHWASLKASSCEDVDFFVEKVWFFGMLKYALLHSPNEIIGKGVSGVLRSVLKCSTKNAKKLLWGTYGSFTTLVASRRELFTTHHST
jgi:hypothetical protein